MLKLRMLLDGDLPLVETWLNHEHVKRWYEIPRLDVKIEDWIREMQERRGEFRWLNHIIVLWQDCPIGMCQYYKCEDSLDEDFGTLPTEGSYGIDYLIGEEAYLGKGYGKRMIAALLDLIFALPDAKRVTADIDRDNKASEGTLLSCGFVLVDAQKSRYVLHKKIRKTKSANRNPAYREVRGHCSRIPESHAHCTESRV